MTEETQIFVDAVLGAENTDKAVETYLEAPKAIRRAAYNAIREKDATKAKKIRAAVEARRGIGFRTLEGDLVMEREAMKAQVVRLVQKQGQMDERKAKLGERVVELKKQAQKFYGDEFLAELEGVIEQA